MSTLPGYELPYDRGEYYGVGKRTNLKGRPAAHEWTGTYGTLTGADNTLYMTLVHIPAKTTITGLKFEQATQGDTTADNENRIGLYSIDAAADSLTLVASCADSGVLWEGAAGIITKAFTTPYEANPGLYYAAGLLNWSAAATAPVIRQLTLPSANFAGLGLDNALDLAGTIAAQNTLPATSTVSAVASTASVPLFYPY